MATIAGLVVRIAGDTSGLRKEINAAQRQLNNAFGTKGMAFSKGMVKGMTAVGAAMGAMGVKALSEAAKLQQVQVAFTNLLGSAQKADNYIRKLYDFANNSPFSFEELAKGAQRLMAMGYEGEEALTTLRAIGDATAGIGNGTEGISRISLALGQIKAKGTVQAEEMRQLAENGIPAWDMLAKKLGVDVATAMKMVEKRSVSAKVGIEALTEGMAGRYGGMMAQQAEKIRGGWEVAMSGVQRVLAQTGLKIDETFDVAKNLRTFGLSLSKFSEEIADSGITGALLNLIPPGVQGAIVGIAGAITYTMIPALTAMAANAKIALVGFAPLAAKLILAGAIIGGVAHVISEGMKQVAESRKEFEAERAGLNDVSQYSKYSSDDYDAVSSGFNLYGGFAQEAKKATTTTSTNTEPSKISQRISKEYNKVFKDRVAAVDQWYAEEKATLDKSITTNNNYQTDLLKLNELYAQKKLNARKEEAESLRKITEDVSKLAYDSQTSLLSSLYGGTGKEEIEQMKLDYLQAIEEIDSKWLEQKNNFISMTDSEKQAYLKALEGYGIAYEQMGNAEINFTKQVEAEKLALKKQYIDQETEYLRQAKDVQKNIEKAYAMNSIAMLKEALQGENSERLQAYEENKAIMQAYEDSWREAHIGIKERITNTIMETKDSLNTFFQDVLSYGSSFSESFSSLLSNIGSGILSQITSSASSSIAYGLMGMFGGGKEEEKDNALGDASKLAAASITDMSKSVTAGTGVIGKMTTGVTAYNAIESLITGTTKPAEATATVTATSALGTLTASATAAAVALKAVSASGFASPLKFVGAATGGAIYGAGTGTSDSIPAMLSNGEYVVRAAAVKQLGVPFLDALNTGDYSGFSTGGLVTPDYSSGKQIGGGGSQVINVSLSVNAIDAASFEEALRNGGLLEPIKQALYDDGRNFAGTAGVW